MNSTQQPSPCCTSKLIPSAVATHCYFEDELRVTYLASAERIRRAQTSLPERIPNVWTGPTPNASSARGSTSTTSTAV